MFYIDFQNNTIYFMLLTFRLSFAFVLHDLLQQNRSIFEMIISL